MDDEAELDQLAALTGSWQERYLRALAASNPPAALAAAGVTAGVVRNERKRNSAFDDACQIALASARGEVEDSLRDLAVNGYRVPVYYRGEEVGEYRKRSVAAAVAWLRANDGRYRKALEKPKATGGGGSGAAVGITINVVSRADAPFLGDGETPAIVAGECRELPTPPDDSDA